jgi:hypothetical protein
LAYALHSLGFAVSAVPHPRGLVARFVGTCVDFIPPWNELVGEFELDYL